MSRKLSPCGTPAAAKRHRRNDESLCDECRAAEQDEKNERAAKKREEARVKIPDVPAVDVLDELAELRRMYNVLKTHMGDAPPQSIAAIVRQADAVLVRIKEIESSGEKSEGGLLDGVPLPSNVTRLPGAHVAS